MLGHVTQPRALPQAFEEAAASARRARVLTDPGQHLDEPVDEARDTSAGPLFQFPEVYEQGTHCS